MRIMLIDDNRDSTEQLVEVLTYLGHECNAYSLPQQAVAAYSPKTCDLVITDLVMPYMDGKAVLENILQQCEQAIVVVMTALAIDNVMHELIASGAYAVISKPLEVEKVVQLIGEIAVCFYEPEI